MHHHDASSNQRLLSAVPINNFENTVYTINVTVGSNHQKMTVLLDTGSSRLVLNSQSKYSEKFTCSDSTSCKQGAHVSYNYLSGSISGDLCVDTVQIGDFKLDDYKFMEIFDGSPSGYFGSNFYGILGMGMSG